jgi:hypothetical protein
MSSRRKVSRSSALILWHPAFCEAISMDLEPWKDVLEFKFEYELTTGPLKIDVLVIRKLTADPIEGNIATLFRENNILENIKARKTISPWITSTRSMATRASTPRCTARI